MFTLSTADRPYRMFVENMRDGAATVSSSGVILYANRRLAELLACPRESIVGSPLARFVAGGLPLGLDEIRGPDGLGTTIEFDLVDTDGMAVPVLVGSSPLEVDGDDLTCLTFTDLSAQKAQDREIARLSRAQAERMADLQDAQAALTKQATHDALTGLPNRALLVRPHRPGPFPLEALRSVHRRPLRRPRPVQAGQRLPRACRRGHRAAQGRRAAGVDPAADGHRRPHRRRRVRRARSRCRKPPARGRHRQRGSSPSCAALPLGSTKVTRSRRASAFRSPIGGRGTAESLLNEADKAMYRAKSLGGRRAEVFDAALGRQVQQRSNGQRMLQSALDDHRIIVYYQPLIDLPSGSVAGFEALARITEHDGSILPPAAFIAVAEDSGLIVPLGAEVLELALFEARRWQPAGAPEHPLTIAVNLSARQFEPGDLPAVVSATLARTGLDPACLHLELTETAIIDLRPDILQQLGHIRDLGVQIGLDDFGTGYASLTHLRRLPVTFVKIDQTFVQGLGVDDEDERIVAAVVDLAANLGLRSIAEGVETDDQLDRLRELGCDQAQGYLFARPLPPSDVTAAITNSVW